MAKASCALIPATEDEAYSYSRRRSSRFSGWRRPASPGLTSSGNGRSTSWSVAANSVGSLLRRNAMKALRERLAVKPEDLRRRLDPATLPFQTTAEVKPVKTTIGQPRAAEAIAFALEVGARGFHLYVAGSPGTGRESTVLEAVQSFAATRATPPDWVYVHNFAEPDGPRAFAVPTGQGRRLAMAMTSFLEAAQREIPRAFESEDYARRREQSLAEVSTRRAKLITDLQAFAQERGFALEMTQAGDAATGVRAVAAREKDAARATGPGGAGRGRRFHAPDAADREGRPGARHGAR